MTDRLGNRWFRYVGHDRLQEYLDLGWKDTGCIKDDHHGIYATICVFIGSDDPPEPPDLYKARRGYKNRPGL